jgi:glycosyltransferase involved in cell wall biosynthesis
LEPRVSVIIPTYNHETYLAQAVDSALGQTFQSREVIVVDDGSTDRTPAILAGYGTAIRAVRKPNGGTSSALNAGIRLAGGEWVAWLSADDFWEPQKLERQLEFAVANPHCAVIYTDWHMIDGAGTITATIRHPHFATQEALIAQLFQGCCINGSTTLVRRVCFDHAGLFDEQLPQAHDWDMWLRLARDYRFGHLAEPLIRYRWHGANMSAGSDAPMYTEPVLAKARAYYGLDVPASADPGAPANPVAAAPPPPTRHKRWLEQAKEQQQRSRAVWRPSQKPGRGR